MSGEVDNRWGLLHVLGYCVLVAVVFIVAQIAVTFLLLLVLGVMDPTLDIEAFAEDSGSNGLVLAIATLGTAAVCVPFIKYLVGRRESDPWTFLGFTPTSARKLAVWSLALIAFVGTSDLLSIVTERPVVPEFMTDVYASANRALLFVAIVFAAPLLEEIFFRGFVISSLRSSGIAMLPAALVSSLAWAAMHVQYDLYGIATIFFMGLLLAAARAKTRSLWPCISMHAVANSIAFVEAATST